MTARQYNIVAELDAPFDGDSVDSLLGPIVEHSGAVGRSELGRAEVVFTVPAATTQQAATTALALLKSYEAPLLSLRVLSTADFDRLTDAIELPPLVSVTEAASSLGISRQGVLNAISTKKLPATRVGDTWVLRAGAVDAYVRS
ncbi:helix-turn-helix domain-containing protein [Rhodococcoides fascians]|uniref:helix-turn-helix domain-containing protein n=1 Tax=Rhodococcoides fascians TaxID=1828 RepID=UPI00050CD1CD|nr:helix-turn-helix domain-containing protein [Rhodococcus fascians]